MNIDFKNFDYKLIATSQREKQIVPKIVGFPNERVQHNFRTEAHPHGQIIHCFSRIEFMHEGQTNIYEGHSTYLLPFEQHVSRRDDMLAEIDEAIFSEFLYQHLSRQTQVIFLDTDSYLTIPSIRDLYLTIQNQGDVLNN